MGFWSDFGKGFQRGFSGAAGVLAPVAGLVNPAAGAALGATGKIVGSLHSGGKVPKTGTYRLKKGEVVLNKTQQAKVRKAKTAKTAKKAVSAAANNKPKTVKRQPRKCGASQKALEKSANAHVQAWVNKTAKQMVAKKAAKKKCGCKKKK